MNFQLSSLREAYANGLNPLETVAQVFQRIAAVGDPGIFIALRDRADIEADAGKLGAFDPGKPLWGIPFAIKDNIDVAGLPTTAACPEFAFTPKKTAFAVQKLLDAGALLIGKTNLDQFATGLVGVRTPYPVPRNAVAPELVPGGSSSGSAVAVAHGIVTFALGTDTAGSGRVPAALNNIVGLKPSVGAISARGVLPACRTLDCISVFALNVDDAWAAFTVMAGDDPDEPYSRAIDPTPLGVLPGLRVGVPSPKTREFFGDSEAEQAFETALDDLKGLGAEIVEIDFTALRETAELVYGGPWVAERYQAIRAFIEEKPGALHPLTRTIIEGASRLSAADAFGGLYKLAELRRRTEPMWRELDMLAVPSIPAVYTRDEVEKDPIALNSRLGLYTNFVNLLDLCALAVPCKFRGDGRPAGVTLIAPRGQDGFLASFGRLLHKAAGVSVGASKIAPRYEELKPILPAGWLEIVAVGAHMSGLPLNHELKSEGAVFLREVKTAPEYRLFALPGGATPRPGLLRCATNAGTQIACEVWALPADGFGRFVSRIPSPLGIGTIILEDGARAKGFLVEAEAVRQAEDISSFGGWRAFLSANADAE